MNPILQQWAWGENGDICEGLDVDFHGCVNAPLHGFCENALVVLAADRKRPQDEENEVILRIWWSSYI